MNYQKLAEQLNKLTNEKHIIRIGRYSGDCYIGNNEFKNITGDIFVMTNYGNLFRVVSDDSSIIDDFDIIGSDAIITPINKKKEYGSLSYNLVNVSNKEDLRAYFPNDEIGKEMFECTQSVPIRFRKDALDLFIEPEDRTMWDLKTVDKAWTYFLDKIVTEMTKEERKTYRFG